MYISSFVWNKHNIDILVYLLHLYYLSSSNYWSEFVLKKYKVLDKLYFGYYFSLVISLKKYFVWKSFNL